MKKFLLLSILFFAILNISFSQDDPCSAIELPLSPVGSCNYIIGDNTGATDSDLVNPNIDAPSGCEPVSANYNGADVWFYIDLGPSTTSIEIDLTHIATSNFDDGVIALYTGTCGGNLSIVECDDDSGVGFLEPYFSVNALTPNTRVYVRVWEWGGFDQGTFNICASEFVPPPPLTCGDTFYDTGGVSGNYSNNEFETTTIFPTTPGDAVTATFTSFNTESNFDELYVYDGPNAASPLLGVFSGSTIPGPFTSSDPTGALTFVFDSDNSITYSGWEASLSCAPYTPPTICGSTIYDSGGAGGNYENNELITTTLIPDIAGTAIVATFTAFNLENGYDYLEVFDGPNNTFPSLGNFTGTGIPGPFTSSHPSGSLTFVFDSDSSITSSGYAIDITCVNTCNLLITDTNYPIGSTNCDLDYIELTTNALPPPPIATVFSESFDGTSFPAGWTEVNGATSADWIISNSTNAGGTASEAMLDWTGGSHNSTWRLNSPLIDITGYTNLQLNFSQDFDIAGTSTLIGIYVQTSTDNINWTTQYSNLNPTTDVTTTENIDISALDGNNNLYIRFRLSGNTTYLLSWAIDDISVTADAAPLPPQITWSPDSNLYTDSTLTTPYVAGNYAGTVYAAPNGTQTYTATDQNSCSDMVTVTFNKKIWNGTAGNIDWSTDANWFPIGVPTNSNCIVIPNTGGNDPIIDGATNGGGYNLTIENGAALTQQPNSTLTIVNSIEVETGGTYAMEDSSSLIQVDDVANTVNGTFTMNRNTNIRVNDYVYWSSPVTSFNIQDISPATPNGYKFEWLPTASQGIGPPGNMVFGEWQGYDSGAMNVGKGYIVKGPTGHTATPSNYTATFSGNPNNGTIVQPIERGTYTGINYTYQPIPGGDNLLVTSDDDNWNLIGNPYPSAINAIDFLTHTNNGNISGSVYLWTHGTDIGAGNTDPFYDDYVYNYNVADYVAYNSSGASTPLGFNGNIGAGQGFFVLMTDAASTTETVTFDNTMRSSTYANNQFYRTSNPSNMDGSAANRIWLDYVNASGQTSTTLVAYIDGATYGEDRMFDAHTTAGNGLNLYSLIDDKTFLIQGREMPFDNNDQVPIGLNITESGIHTIAINTLQGLFNDNNQDIFIEDLLNDTIHNIKESPYSFTSQSGIINDRFVLRFTNTTLGLEDLDTLSGVVIFEDNEKITVKSNYGTITSIDVYDVLGRTLYSNKTVNVNRLSLKSISPNNATLILKIKLTDGKQKIAKVIF
ncbi:hypothetical protein BWZ20_11555 [Winogradskyella sp. J14-2]|uniref:CUB domain-containing protein n=1 Tax=Winogradskyella sp. J14-2 TaxID=1936080 RepID=UPI000972BED3|nr:CUB domain-containing protein [Winogradskyella sp. J14-2]APY08899.1 hypothetical protein BWZ20_11555 [Winogradskyella sp. J14-2]